MIYKSHKFTDLKVRAEKQVPYNTSEDYLRQIFSVAGEVANLQLFRKNGESRGFLGFYDWFFVVL